MTVGGLVLHEDGERDGGEDEDPGQPGSRFGEEIGGGAGSESGLGALAAEGGGEVRALALLEQDDDDEQQTNDDVDGGDEDDHGILKNLIFRRTILAHPGAHGRRGLEILVRKGGLEPPCLLGATPSRWCVCQFHHFRT
jgi:hypothetical protein